MCVKLLNIKYVNMSRGNKDLLLLLERPKEPVFLAKGNQQAVFDVPSNFLENRFKPIGVQLVNRFGEQATDRIPVNEIQIPDISVALQITRFENFSVFVPKHRRAAGRLIEVFMGMKSVDELKSVAVYARDRVNPYLFNYALSVTLMHRKDTKNLDVPSFVTSFPDKFIDGTVLQKAREEANIIPDGSRMPINLNRESDQMKLDVSDLERWRDRLYAAIHSGSIQLPNGQTEALTEFGGVDLIGNIMEASILSPNTNFYGDLHNLLHDFLSLTHDPDGRHLEAFGVVGDPATAMRDPVFYRLHAFVDDLFQELKQTLPPYSNPQLNYQGISVTGVEVDVDGVGKNNLQTFWQQSDVEISRGLDFTPRGAVFVRFTHLQHAPFTYRIAVNNQTKGQKMGTCRIFLAPKFDERGTNWLLRDQRLMFIELDRFTVTLKQGQNTIVRRSTESSLTIPFNRTFRDLDTNRPTDADALAEFNFCGCGWPQHMLIPKGSPDGFRCELFVMISNYEDDKIEQTLSGQCNDAYSFCGLKDRLYPDRRPMGFPFDRMPPQGVDTLQQYLHPNMRVQDITITFTERTVQQGVQKRS
ncbi:Prophenoloxidase 2 [Carabus blaptoides fortunei]